MVVAVLFKAGDHVPIIGGMLLELVGNGAKTSPIHIGATAVNSGVILGFTVIVMLAVLAHCPKVGVNV